MLVKSEKDGVGQHIHDEQKRLNNPPLCLVTAETDHLNGRKTYQFDPHLDPQLQWLEKPKDSVLTLTLSHCMFTKE